MGNNIERLGEPRKNDAVAITENHLYPIPESVIVFVFVMDRTDEVHTKIVNGIPAENVVVEIEGRTETIVSLIDR